MPLGKPDVRKMLAKRNIKGLIKALGYKKDMSIQRQAVDALGRLGDARAVEPLIAFIKDSTASRARDEAAEALGRIEDPLALGPLKTALEENDPFVRKMAAEKLGQMGDSEAVSPLIAILNDEDVKTRLSAAKALVKIGGHRTVKALIATLENKDPKLRGEAADILGEIGDRQAVRPLIAALKDGNSHVRIEAAASLGQIGDKEAVNPLITSLSDGQIRLNAALALKKLGWKPTRDEKGAMYYIALGECTPCEKIGTSAVPPLLEALNHTGTSSRMSIAEVLGRIADTRAVDPLVALLKDEDQWLREKTALALGQIGDGKAVEALAALLEDRIQKVRLAAAEALDKLGWEPPQDEQGVRYWMAKGDWKSCVAVGAPALKPLLSGLEDKDPAVLESTARALGEMRAAEAVKPLIAAFSNVRSEVREAVIEALGRIGAPAVAPLIDVIKGGAYYERNHGELALSRISDPLANDSILAALKNETNPRARKAAAVSLGRIGEAGSADLLLDLLREEDMSMAAAEGLGHCGDPRAVEPLIEMLKNSHIKDVLRLTASEALKNLYSRGKLDQAAKAKILAHRRAIEERYHTDEHWENEKGCVSGHTDSTKGVKL